MFTLLAPIALAAFALLAIPIIIHLLKPKRVRTMPFSSLRWLRSSTVPALRRRRAIGLDGLGGLATRTRHQQQRYSALRAVVVNLG